MPKYDFRCNSCQDEAEFIFSIHDSLPASIVHLECDGDYRRVYNATASHFKGKGWGKTYGVHKGKQIDG